MQSIIRVPLQCVVRLVGREAMPGVLGFGFLPLLSIRRNARQAAYCALRPCQSIITALVQFAQKVPKNLQMRERHYVVKVCPTLIVRTGYQLFNKVKNAALSIANISPERD